MFNNCFTYTYKQLYSLDYKVPKAWGKYTNKDMKLFIKDYKMFLDNKLHFKFFESFCKYVKDIKKHDIIISNECIGIAVNKFKFMTIRERDGLARLYDIEKDMKAMRVQNG